MKVRVEKIYHQAQIPIDLSLHKPYNFTFSTPEVDYWERVMRLNTGKVVVIKTTQKEPMTTKLQTQIQTETKLSAGEKYEVKKRVEYEIGIDERLEGMKVAAKYDPIFRHALYSTKGYRLYANSSILEGLISILFSQRNTYFAYKKKRQEFLERYGEPVPWRDDLLAFPKRSTILDLPLEEWERFGSRKFQDTLRYLLNNLRYVGTYTHYPDKNQAFSKLTSLKGIGQYTARFLLTFCGRNYRKVFLDNFVRDKLEEIYGLHNNLSSGEYDSWSYNKFGIKSALGLHIIIAAHYPKELRHFHKENKLWV